jgi:hypothetical protein
MTIHTPPTWDEAYTPKAGEALDRLRKVVKLGAAVDLSQVRHQLAINMRPGWMFVAVLANPILHDLCHAAVHEQQVDMAPYRARLAAVASMPITGDIVVSPADLARLTGEEAMMLFGHSMRRVHLVESR